jgi:hypothetical protein
MQAAWVLMRQQQIGQPAPMMGGIAKAVLQPQRTPQEKLRIAIPGEAKATVKLHRAVTCEHKAIA